MQLKMNLKIGNQFDNSKIKIIKVKEFKINMFK